MTNLGVWHLLILLVLALPFIVAAISIARSTTASGLEKAVWVLVVLAFPLLGPLMWFLVGRRSAHGAQPRS